MPEVQVRKAVEMHAMNLATALSEAKDFGYRTFRVQDISSTRHFEYTTFRATRPMTSFASIVMMGGALKLPASLVQGSVFS